MGQAAEFGRFGYANLPTIPGWQVSLQGIKPKFARSDELGFDTVVSKCLVAQIKSHEASYTLVGGGKGPTRMRVNLFAPGPELLFERGFRMKLSTLQPPLLSWGEGSVGDGVETPKCRWLALSFQDSQPPILMTFLNEPAALRLTGKTGDWTLETVGEYKKWVRFALPLGVRAWTTTDASALGEMVKMIHANEPFWAGPSPVLKSVTATSDTDSVTGTWRFSGPNAVVPLAAFLARRGGYNVQVLTPIKEIPAPTNEGPVAYTSETFLTIRFPVLNLPRGRSLTAGNPAWKSAVPNSTKLFSVFNSGMAAMVAPRSIELPEQLRASLEAYLSSAPFSVEPNTKTQLPFTPTGQGAGEAAMYSLLQQALLCGEGLNTRPNPLFISLLWARDSVSWQLPMIQEPRIRRRASAVASIAGALSADPKMRLDGAMFQAGLAAERGLSLWLGAQPPATFLEPMDEFRARLYKAPELPKREPVLPMLVNPIRLLIGPSISANNTATGYLLRWNAERTGPQKLLIQSPQELTFAAKSNLVFSALAMKSPNQYLLYGNVARKGPTVLEVTVRGGKPIKLPPISDIIYTETIR